MKATKTAPPVKPWSKKRRVVTAAWLSLLIFGMALVIGGSLYAMGRKLNIIKRQSIKDAVMEEAMNNSELAEAIIETVKITRCENEVYEFRVGYDDYYTLIPGSEKEQCTKFNVINSTGESSIIQIKPWSANENEALEVVLSGIDQVVTDSFPQSNYEAVVVRGVKDQRGYAAVVISGRDDSSFVVEVDPADPLSEQRMMKLAELFELL